VQDRRLAQLRIVISGAGAAGIACGRILLAAGVTDLVLLDSRGVLVPGRAGLTGEKAALAAITNPRRVSGDLIAALAGADVFVGLSGARMPEHLLGAMAPDGMVFALSNPDPEVHPDVAGRYAGIVATGRSDFPNQINNVLAFPGVFRGALDAGARRITGPMKLAAAEAIFAVASDDLAPDRIVPSPFDPRVAPAVSAAVATAADLPPDAE
jgi:malate dehydrogenase (oxaloacetate-decarboxylating)